MHFQRIKISVGIVTAAFSVGLGCAHSMSDVCSRDLVRWNETVDQAIFTLQKVSVSPQGDRSDEINWLRWSEVQLTTIERRMEGAVGSDPRRRQMKSELSNIANSWVEFHGYAQLRQQARM